MKAIANQAIRLISHRCTAASSWGDGGFDPRCNTNPNCTKDQRRGGAGT